MSNNFILVSAYINIEKWETDISRSQTFSTYLEAGQQLLDLPIRKIIFIDNEYANQFQGNEHTVIIPITLEELDIYSYYQTIINPVNEISCLSHNPVKDTPLFHLVQLAKTEFITRAINIKNISNKADEETEDLPVWCWLDFGIRKIFTSYEEFHSSICTLPSRIMYLKNLGQWQSNKVKIPGCWNLNPNDNSEFNSIRWYFCGGFFAGTKEVLLEFEKEVKKELASILAEQKRIIFEVNIWFRIWKRGGLLVDWYWGDHNSSMMGLGSFGRG